jgi:hypothetical protein
MPDEYSSSRGSIDLSDFVSKLKALYPHREVDQVYRKAIRNGGWLLADRIEACIAALLPVKNQNVFEGLTLSISTPETLAENLSVFTYDFMSRV